MRRKLSTVGVISNYLIPAQYEAKWQQCVGAAEMSIQLAAKLPVVLALFGSVVAHRRCDPAADLGR